MYRRLLATRGVPKLVAVALLTRLGTPVLSLALLLVVVESVGSYAAGGLVLTGHALALALCAPLGGRLADRLGPRRVLAAYLAAHAATYVLLLLALSSRAPAAAVIGVAVLLGASTPPLTPVIRSAWPRLVPEEMLHTAYALDSASNELMFIVGPLLVSALLLVMPGQAVVLMAGAAVLLGTALLLASRSVRANAPTPVRRAATGPLSHRPTLVLLVIAAFGTFGFGCLRIATVASATAFGSTASAGVLMGLLSAGALAGTLAFGARPWPVAARTLLVAFCLVDAASMLASAAAPGILTLGALVLVTGLLTGPRDALVPAMLGEGAPPEYRTEVFSWLNTFMWAGYGLGAAVAGRLTGPADSGALAFAAAACVAVLGALLALRYVRPGRPAAEPAAAADRPDLSAT